VCYNPALEYVLIELTDPRFKRGASRTLAITGKQTLDHVAPLFGTWSTIASFSGAQLQGVVASHPIDGQR
jgi:isoleucyl-tRNA synthetase